MLAATAAVQAPHMLEGVQPGDVLTEPYPHHARPHAVPADLYRQLEA